MSFTTADAILTREYGPSWCGARSALLEPARQRGLPSDLGTSSQTWDTPADRTRSRHRHGHWCHTRTM